MAIVEPAVRRLRASDGRRRMLGLHRRLDYSVTSEAEQVRYLARLAVDRRINQLLREMPCFCTPQRPELGREDWCSKHWLLKRLDPEAIAAEVAQ